MYQKRAAPEVVACTQQFSTSCVLDITHYHLRITVKSIRYNIAYIFFISNKQPEE